MFTEHGRPSRNDSRLATLGRSFLYSVALRSIPILAILAIDFVCDHIIFWKNGGYKLKNPFRFLFPEKVKTDIWPSTKNEAAVFLASAIGHVSTSYLNSHWPPTRVAMAEAEVILNACKSLAQFGKDEPC